MRLWCQSKKLMHLLEMRTDHIKSANVPKDQVTINKDIYTLTARKTHTHKHTPLKAQLLEHVPHNKKYMSTKF